MCVTPVKIVRCCWMVVDASNVWDRILGRIVVIPFPNHPTFVRSATFRTTGQRWATSHCTKEGTVWIARVRSGANDIEFLFGPFGVATRRTCARPCRNWQTSLATKSWLDGWDWRPSAGPLRTSHDWRMHAFECWSRTTDGEVDFRIAIVSPMTGSLLRAYCSCLFRLLSTSCFVRTGGKSTSVQPSESINWVGLRQRRELLRMSDWKNQRELDYNMWISVGSALMTRSLLIWQLAFPNLHSLLQLED